MAWTPSQYKARYWNLPVWQPDGTTTTVKVNRYRLNSPAIGNVNQPAMKAFMQKWSKGVSEIDDLQVQTGDGFVTVDPAVLQSWGGFIRYAFLGKGSPELIQVVLQLADCWELAPDGLQKYADSALGLDCNGFVGNYLWHVKHNHPWTELGYGDHDLGADAYIDEYFRGSTLLDKWEKMDFKQSYLMAAVDGAGNIIQGGGGGIGHVVITEPNRSQPVYPDNPKIVWVASTFRVWVVESTGGHDPGLWESWYSSKGVTTGKVFTVSRPEMTAFKTLAMKIAPVR